MLYGMPRRSIWDEMDRFFSTGRTKEDLGQYLYRVDIDETDRSILVTMEIPGIEKKEDLHIEVDGNVLTIQGEVRRSRISDEKRYQHQSERYYGHFKRVVTLPAEVKSDGAHASYQNGVLELEFIKDSRPAARTIEVKFNSH